MLACQKPLKCGVVTGKDYIPARNWYGQNNSTNNPSLAFSHPMHNHPYYYPKRTSTWHHVPEKWTLEVDGITCDGDRLKSDVDVSEAVYSCTEIGDSVWFGCQL